MSIAFSQPEPPPPPPLDAELFRFRKADGREAFLVLRDIPPIGVELRQLLKRPDEAAAEFLWSKFFAYGYRPSALDDVVFQAALKWEAAGWTRVESPTAPNA